MKLPNRFIKDQNGSLTIEASIAMVLFSFVMVFLITLTNACRVQAAIQNSLDKAALELSQEMYLYEATGLYYATVDVSGEASNAANSAVNTINSGGNIIDAGVGAYNNGSNSQIGQDLSKFTSPGGLAGGMYSLYSGFKNTDTDHVSTVLSTVDGKKGTLNSSYETIRSNMKNASGDPVNFIVQLGKYGLNSVTSYYFGSSLGESLTVDYLGCNNDGKDEETYADEWLKQLGVVDGVSGLNFNKSSIFAPASPTNINLVVTYDVNIYPLLGDFKVTFAQSASTRAWLGGDLTVARAFTFGKSSGSGNNTLPAVG
ncbi:MAG: hypothetical protein K6F76_01240 [Clostridiales bacterium]|nr:hypothetical protein [Clostridiales bacterium]